MRENFTLLGHSNPLGKYPAPVVPVGRLNNEVVAIYAVKDEPDVVPIDESCSFIHHLSEIDTLFREFDYRSDRLFALDEEHILIYHVREEASFFFGLLTDPSFSQENPFLRLSLAKATRKAFVIAKELPSCIREITRRTPHYLNMWIDEEKTAIARRLVGNEVEAALNSLESLRPSLSLPQVSVTMKELLEAGVHFGHQVRRWNPKMKEYIFGERNGIYIIDLLKTQRMFRDAIAFVTEAIAEDRGKTVLFVGTKRQAQDAVREEAERAGQYYVNQRWLGGLMTNFQTVQKSIKRLRDLEVMQIDGRYEQLTKKERIKLNREREGLNRNLSGIKNMERLPDVVFIIDVRKEEIAVAEANRLGIPIVAVVDTNCSPEGIDHVIPGNDDALRAVRLFASRIADAILQGQQIASEGRAAIQRGDEGHLSQVAVKSDPRSVAVDSLGADDAMPAQSEESFAEQTVASDRAS